MKLKKILAAVVASTVALIAPSIAQAGAMNAGDIVVLRYGNGSAPLPGDSTTALPAFLDEYKLTGATAAFVQSIPLPSTGPNALTGVATGSRDGIIQRSSDGQYIVVGGFRTTAGSTVGSGNPLDTTIPVSIGRVGLDGIADTTTAYVNSDGLRSVASPDGNSFYTSDNSGSSAKYVTYGPSATATALLSKPYRSVKTFNGQLYGTSGSTGNRGISTIGSGLPIAPTQTATSITGQAAGTGPGMNDFFVASPSIIYATGTAIASSGDDFRRYVFNGTSYSYGAASSTTPVDATKVIASPDGDASAYGTLAMPDGTGGFDVYFSTKAGLYYVHDADPTGTNFGSLAVVPVAGAAAPANTVFRGLATAVPEPTVFAILAPAAMIFASRRRK